MKTQFTFDPHFGQLRNRDGDSIACIPKGEPETGLRIAASLNACAGLALPENVKPGILAELVTASRGVLTQAIYDHAGRHDMPESLVSEPNILRLQAVLASLSDPAPPMPEPLQALADRTEAGTLAAARDRVSEILEDPAGDGEDLRDAVATLLVALNGEDNREPVSPPEPPVFQGDLEALRKHLPDPDNMGSSEYTAIHETIFDSFSPDDGDTPAEFARNVCREFIAGAQGILAKLEPVSPDEDDHLINWRAMHRDSGDVYCADGTLTKGTDKAAPTFTGMGHKEACEHAVSLFGVNATAYAESRNVPPVSPA